MRKGELYKKITKYVADCEYNINLQDWDENLKRVDIGAKWALLGFKEFWMRRQPTFLM